MSSSPFGIESDALRIKAAGAAFSVVRAIGRRFPQKAFQPPWSPAPLAKQREKSAPPLGWPRRTDSLRPVCGREARSAVLSGGADRKSFMHDHPGEIPADIVERDGRIVMQKTCPRHGSFEDVIANDPAFLARIE